MSRRKTTEQFIQESREMHGDKYDYSLVEYKSRQSKVKIVCPLHGIFEQRPSCHISSKQGCIKCARKFVSKKFSKTTEQFIQESREMHGDKYDYSMVDYKSDKTKVKIICPVHGEFEQVPRSHLRGDECRACSYMVKKRTKKKTTEQFIQESREMHGDKYDYSMVDYKGAKLKVKIICPVHGEFEQTPGSHLKSKHGCGQCGNGVKKTKEQFIRESNEIHGDKYDYSLVKYINNKNKVKIICPVHGEFEQTPHRHLRYGCNQCGTDRAADGLSLSVEEFVQKAKDVHGDRYDYSDVVYKNFNTKVKIICPVHGEFRQLPSNHICQIQMCPQCSLEQASSRIEKEIQDFVEQYTPIVRNDRTQVINPITGWFLELDIWIPLLNKAIEFNGTYWHSLGDAHIRDRVKVDTCKAKMIDLLVIEEEDWRNDKDKVLEELKYFIFT